MKHGKKYQDSVKLIDHLNQYDPDQAAQLVVSTGKAKFDETVEVSIRLGVDPRHADQQVRGAVVLPHGTGRHCRRCRRHYDRGTQQPRLCSVRRCPVPDPGPV